MVGGVTGDVGGSNVGGSNVGGSNDGTSGVAIGGKVTFGMEPDLRCRRKKVIL